MSNQQAKREIIPASKYMSQAVKYDGGGSCSQ